MRVLTWYRVAMSWAVRAGPRSCSAAARAAATSGTRASGGVGRGARFFAPGVRPLYWVGRVVRASAAERVHQRRPWRSIPGVEEAVGGVGADGGGGRAGDGGDFGVGEFVV